MLLQIKKDVVANKNVAENKKKLLQIKKMLLQIKKLLHREHTILLSRKRVVKE